MTKIANIEKNKWLKPWDISQHDDLYNRDDRFFSVLIKGVINFLNSNIVMYGKSINHFVFNTGSSYQYLEKNNYEFKWASATTNDTIYMKLPRCVISTGNISTITSELTQPYARGVYERRDNFEIKGYNAEIRRLPIELSITCHYVLANFNESIILQQEIFDKLVFQRYFKITYLGQIIECSIEFPSETSVSVNKIDMESKETNTQTLDLSLKIKSNYPIINERTESENSKILNTFNNSINLYKDKDHNFKTDKIEYGDNVRKQIYDKYNQ